MPIVRAPDRERKAVHMTFRVTPSVRARIVEAAANNGRSLSAEVEARLENSYLLEERSKFLADIRQIIREELGKA